MKTIHILIIVSLSLFLANSLKAQVTIGSSVPPNKGALLDLKEEDSNSANAKKGLGLPRVILKEIGNLDIEGGVTNLNKAEHIGLVVYNVEKRDVADGITERSQLLCPGVHVWIGEEWSPLVPYPSIGLSCEGTPEFKNCGDPIFGPDGEMYQTALFGNRCWMTQNLRSKVDGSNNAITGWERPSNSADAELGLLYTWEAATKNTFSDILVPGEEGKTTSSVQGICPNGWVLPSDKDWNDLEEYIAKNPSDHTSGGTSLSWDVANTSAIGWRPQSKNGWAAYLMAVDSKQPNGGASGISNDANNKGFSLILTGSIVNSSNESFGNNANMWTSTSAFTSLLDDEVAIYRSVQKGNNKVFRGEASQTAKLSVRCVLR